MRFCCCDLDLNPMTLTNKLDPGIPYLHNKNEVTRSRLIKVRVQTRQTDVTKRIIMPRLRVVTRHIRHGPKETKNYYNRYRSLLLQMHSNLSKMESFS